MGRYESCFQSLKEKRCGAFVPFVVIGDPDQDGSARIIRTLIEAGADALELGIPFSDPLADGPTIQAAMDRALSAGVTPQDCFSIVRGVRNDHPEIPIGLLVYANLVYALGLDEFYRQCADCSIDSVLVADVPVNEVAPFRSAASDHAIKPILLCPPNIELATLEKVAKYGQGYTYLLSRPGVTGTSVAAGRPVEELLRKLRELNAPPTLLGFGISTPEQVTQAIQCGADGVICGSAIIERIESNLTDIDQVTSALNQYVRAMKSATIMRDRNKEED